MARRYGKWAGCSIGTAEDETKCIAEVGSRDSMITVYYQCNRKRGHGPDGAYCKQHARMRAERRSFWVPKDEDSLSAN